MPIQQPSANWYDLVMRALDDQKEAIDDQRKSIDNLRGELAQFRADQPNNYITRRESDQRVSSNAIEWGTLDTRLKQIEEWRYQETVHTSNLSSSLQQQVHLAVVDALKADRSTRSAISDSRQALDGRTITLFVMIAVAVLSAFLMFLSVHVIFH